MKKRTVVLLFALAFLMSLALPFILPSGAVLDDYKTQMMEEMWEDSDSSLLDFLMPSAKAETALTPLPIDFTPGLPLKEANFTRSGYSDDSINLTLETIERDGLVIRVASITIKHPSQLRTATAGKPGSSKVALISSMAQKNNAVLALNANYYSNNPVKTSFEYRMGEMIRQKLNARKDLLIIDENGDFNLFIKSDEEAYNAFMASGRSIINAFTFGPALVKDYQVLEIDDKYDYNPNGKEPRMAIAQLEPLNYMVVLVEGRRKNSEGVTMAEMADIMFELGAEQAFNLDGGNSATLVFNGGYYQSKTKANERAQSDMIYFASIDGD